MMLRPRHLAAHALAWAVAGGTAGAIVGLIDGFWSWSAMAQFAPGIVTRLRAIAFTAVVYGAAGAAGFSLVATVLSLLSRTTRLGRLVSARRQARAAHILRSDRQPGVVEAAFAVAASLATCSALGVAFLVLARSLATRRHPGLVVASAMGGTVVALTLAFVATFALARIFELALQRLAARSVGARLLAMRGTPWVLALAVWGAWAAIALSASWTTSQHLPLRAGLVAAAAIVLGMSLGGVGGRVADLWQGIASTWRRRSWVLAKLVAIALAVLVLGASESVQKASAAYTGLARVFSGALRVALDFDRDGASGFLAGGDCNDFSSKVRPGAADIPGDGIDQNCIGGDAEAPVPRAPEFGPRPATLPSSLSVVLITIDTLRADHLGAYGYDRPTSPVLDGLAKNGALFVNAWAHAPSTRYSIPAILTGRYPLSVYYDTTVQGWPGLLPKGPSIAELMRSAGRTTAAILNYWYFDEERGMNRGFDHYDNSNKRLHRGVPGEGPAETRGSSSAQQTDKALAFLDRNGEQPFFLWVHYYDPHYQYERHEGVQDFGSRPVDLYDHEIRYTDREIGRLLDGLRARGLYDQTAVVVTGDHGEGFGEHGIDLHGYHLYAAQTKVPLIIRVPGIEPSRPTTPVAHIDILPTLAHLVGATPSPAMQGRSLLPTLTGEADRDADGWVFQELSYENDNEVRAAASRHCHVIFQVSPATAWELYRIDVDPGEERDVIADPGPCADARQTLERWYDRSQIPEGAVEALMPAPPSASAPLASLGSRVELIEVEAPAQVRAGSVMEVTYTFRSLAPLSDDWRVFSHFEGPAGARFTDDHAPTRPLSWWKAGEYIRYSREVRIPPSARPGSYALWTGMFRKDERLSAAGGRTTIHDDRVRAASFEVVR